MATLIITVETKVDVDYADAIDIDRDVRLILRDHLEAAIRDAQNDRVCNRLHETPIVGVRIANVC